VDLGSFRLDAGRGYWAAPVPVNPLAVSRAEVVADDGTVLATAHLPRLRR
jgi:hypothetical protein